jgi:polyisoprenyl-phosphate glycosyltransferase
MSTVKTAEINMSLSIVIPVYQAENLLHELINRINESVKEVFEVYQVVLVDDGSRDNSWKVIESICAVNENIKALKLSRNFGQQHAITAGLDYCNGDWVIVMDCDLQDRPEEIKRLYEKAKEGFDIVFASRNNRKDTFWTKNLSRLFYKVYSYLTGIKQDATIANFGIYSHKVIEVIRGMKEPMRAFSSMARWVGFNRTSIEVEHGERFHGKSSNTISKKMNLALDIILSYSDKPLKIIVTVGFLISLSSFIAVLYLLYRYFSGQIIVLGYTSIVISIWMLSGIIIFILGIVGLYITRIFSGIKNRPLYIVDEKLNCN